MNFMNKQQQNQSSSAADTAGSGEKYYNSYYGDGATAATIPLTLFIANH